MDENFVTLAVNKNRVVTMSLGHATMVEVTNRHTGATMERLRLPLSAMGLADDSSPAERGAARKRLHHAVVNHYDQFGYLCPLPPAAYAGAAVPPEGESLAETPRSAVRRARAAARDTLAFDEEKDGEKDGGGQGDDTQE